MKDTDRQFDSYRPPALVVLGTVHQLTLDIPKKDGCCDGYTYNQNQIVNASQ